MTQSRDINTLSEFLLQAQTQYEVFDLGRGIRNLDKQRFFEWENQQRPAEFPRQDHAWFCIAFWNEKMSDERYIWFIKLPLDERGLVVQAARNQFLEIIISALGNKLEYREDSSAQLPENPFIFQPSQQQLADCNSHIKASLNIPASDLAHVHAYIQAPMIGNWQSLSVQNISDYLILNHGNVSQSLISKSLTLFATPVLNCIFSTLESLELENDLANAIIDFRETTDDPNLSSLALRAMSHSPNQAVQEYVAELVKTSNALDLETLVVISGRFWQVLSSQDLCNAFMHKAAEIDPSFKVFNALFSDLVKVPSCRNEMLTFLRNPERSDLVAEAIGHLVKSH